MIKFNQIQPHNIYQEVREFTINDYCFSNIQQINGLLYVQNKIGQGKNGFKIINSKNLNLVNQVSTDTNEFLSAFQVNQSLYVGFIKRVFGRYRIIQNGNSSNQHVQFQQLLLTSRGEGGGGGNQDTSTDFILEKKIDTKENVLSIIQLDFHGLVEENAEVLMLGQRYGYIQIVKVVNALDGSSSSRSRRGGMSSGRLSQNI